MVKCNDSWKFFDDDKELLVEDAKTFMLLNKTNFQSYMIIYTRNKNNKCQSKMLLSQLKLSDTKKIKLNLDFQRIIQPFIDTQKTIDCMVSKEDERFGKYFKY